MVGSWISTVYTKMSENHCITCQELAIYHITVILNWDDSAPQETSDNAWRHFRLLHHGGGRAPLACRGERPEMLLIMPQPRIIQSKRSVDMVLRLRNPGSAFLCGLPTSMKPKRSSHSNDNMY